MSILINGYQSSWSSAGIYTNTNINKIQIPSGYGGSLIFYSHPASGYLDVRCSIDYGQTFPTIEESTVSDFSVRAKKTSESLNNYEILAVNLFSFGDKIWRFRNRTVNGSNSIFLQEYYFSGDTSRPAEYFSCCATNSDPFHPNDGTYGVIPDQWGVLGHTSGLAVGGRDEGTVTPNWVSYDATGGLGLGSNKTKYYRRDLLAGNLAGMQSFFTLSGGSYALLGSLPTTNTYVFGESGEALNDVDYNTDASTDSGVGYTTNNVYEARGTAKRICSSEDNSHQIVYYVDNITYGTGFVLFNERNFVKKINIPPFAFSNSSVVDGLNNASIGMSYNGQIQAIGAGNKLYVSRNYGL